MRRIRTTRITARIAAFLALVVCLIVAVPSAADAHVYFRGSNPPDGTSLAAAPKAITLDWSSDVVLQYATAQLTDLAGHSIPLPPLQLDPGRPNRVVVPLPHLQAQAYRLTFSVRDQVDLHRTTGSISFAVGGAQAPPPTKPPDPPPAVPEVLMRWLARTGMFIAIGALVIALFVVPKVVTAAGARRKAMHRVLALTLVATVLSFCGDTAVLAYDANGIGSLWPTLAKIATKSAYGHRWEGEVVWSVALLLTVAWLREQLRRGVDVRVLRKGPGRAVPTYVPMGACAIAAALAITVALSGHSSSSGGQSVIGVALRALHLVSVGVWIGALVVAVATIPALGRITGLAPTRVLKAFSPIAAGGLAVVTITGLLLSGTEIATVTALLTTWYGWILLAKLALVGVVMLLGLHHYRLVHRPSVAAHAWPRRTLAAEVLVAAVVVGLGAGLSAALPARGPQFSKPPTPIPVEQTTNAKDLVVTMQLSPNFPGSDLVSAQVVNTRRPVPGPITSVAVTLTPPDSAATVIHLTKTAGDHWDGGQQPLRAGPVAVEVEITRPGLATATARFAWTVNPVPQWRQAAVVSSAPIAPISTALAIAVACASALVAIAARRRGTPHRTEPDLGVAHSPPVPVAAAVGGGAHD